MANTNKQCTITNNSGKDVVITLTVPTTETTAAGATVVPAGGLEVLQTTAGSPIIKAGTSGTVTLDHSCQHSSGSSSYVPQYYLQVCDAEWLMPRAVLPVSQSSGNGTTGFAPQTITAESLLATNPAFTFYQTIALYPDTQLAQEYIAALKAAKEAALAKADGTAGAAGAAAAAMEDALNNFFKKTADYKTLTLADVVAVDSYYSAFPAVWARYTNSAAYYLYGTTNNVAYFMGTLSLKKGGAADALQPGGGYACTFAPAVDGASINKWDVDATKAVQLTYANGLFTDDAAAAHSKISLRGSFVLQRFFTMNVNDTRPTIIITGNVDGVRCIGFNAPQQSAKPVKNIMATDNPGDAVAYWDDLTHPKSLADWITTVMTFTSAVLAIPAMALASYAVYKAVQVYRTPPQPPPTTLPALNKYEVEFGFNTAEDIAYRKALKWTGDTDADRDRDMASHYGLEVEEVVDIALKCELATWACAINSAQRYCVKELLEYEVVMSAADVAELNGLTQALRESQDAIVSIPQDSIYRRPELLPEMVNIVNREMVNAADYTEAYERICNKVMQHLTDDSKELITESTERIKQYMKDMKEVTDEEQKEKTWDAPEIEEIEPVHS